jgi:hypothetical protein
MTSVASQKAENRSQSIVGSLFRKNENNSFYKHAAFSKLESTPAFDFGGINIHAPANNLRVQAKLKINQPGDQYEKEADAMADKVMRMSDKDVAQNACNTSGTSIQRKCAECEKEDEEKKVQRKENSNSSPTVAASIVHDVINSSSGKSMDVATRSFMESRFNYDFRDVRIHDNNLAAKSANSINAFAYTFGNNIIFHSDKYSPNTQIGKRLLAHELTHVVQQSTSTSLPKKSNNQFTQILAPTIQREKKTELTEDNLSWLEKGAVEAAAAPSRALGGTAYRMVKATFRGLILEVKTQMKIKGSQIWDKVNSALTSPTELGAFILHYWWGLVKGIFSPITGLIDLGKFAIQLVELQPQILSTAWTKRAELAADAGKIAEGFGAIAKKGKDAIGGLLSSPLKTMKAIMPWLDNLSNQAETAAESGGHKVGNLLMSQLDKPLRQLGEIGGEIVGTTFINLVLFIYTEGIGNAISQVASKLGELGAVLGKFGNAAQRFGKLAGQLGELLGTIGVWITKAETMLAKAAEAILKPLSPLIEEVGGLIKSLRSFLRELLGVSEKAAVTATEQIGAGAGKTADVQTRHKTISRPEEVAPSVSKPASEPARGASEPEITTSDRPSQADNLRSLDEFRAKKLAQERSRITTRVPQKKIAVGAEDNSPRAQFTDEEEIYDVFQQEQGRFGGNRVGEGDPITNSKTRHQRTSELDPNLGDSKLLGGNLEAAKIPKPGVNYEAHHIVPSGEAKAARVRALFKKRGVPINDSDNGAWLPRGNKSGNLGGEYKHEFTFDDPAFDDEYFNLLEEIFIKEPPLSASQIRLKLRSIRVFLSQGKLPPPDL